MEKVFYSFALLKRSLLYLLLVVILLITNSCKKLIEDVIEPLDPFGTPELVIDNSLTAQSKVAANVNAKKAEYLYEIPTQHSSLWVDCYTESPYAILYMGKLPVIIGDEIIIKDKKRVRQLTICTAINATFNAESKAYNPKIFGEYRSLRFIKIKADATVKSTKCYYLTGWIVDPAAFEGIGGVRILN